jgi:hypothetical protein
MIVRSPILASALLAALVTVPRAAQAQSGEALPQVVRPLPPNVRSLPSNTGTTTMDGDETRRMQFDFQMNRPAQPGGAFGSERYNTGTNRPRYNTGAP